MFMQAFVLVVLGVPLFGLIWAVAALFLRPVLALGLALVAMPSLGLGFFVGLLIQAPFTPQTLPSRASVLTYLAIGAASAVALAVGAGWSFFRLVRPEVRFRLRSRTIARSAKSA
jgi:hypothetical protein